MFNSVAFTVVIGLVFIYLLYSLLATTIQELIASVLKWRAKMLEEGIRRMLDDNGQKILSNQFFDHPLIKYFGRENSINQKSGSGPSYLTATNFSKVLIDMIQTGKEGIALTEQISSFFNEQTANRTLAPETMKIIQSYAAEAGNDITKFRASIEQWYDDMMDRVSGWYKRKTQLWLLIIGSTLAIVFNINTMGIVQKLSHDKDAANTLAIMASNYVKTNQSIPGNDTTANADKYISIANKEINGEIKDANNVLGLGHSYLFPAKSNNSFIQYLVAVVGWLITALAISLGAPFWFDLLNKFVKMRGAGAGGEKK